MTPTRTGFIRPCGEALRSGLPPPESGFDFSPDKNHRSQELMIPKYYQ